MMDRPAGASFDSVVEPCPDPATRPLYWLEIELLGEDDKGIPHEAYAVRLPDGQEVLGYLDEAGLARLEGIAAEGNCRVSFPDRDQDAWVALKTAG